MALRPVPGATVRVARIERPLDGDLNPFLRAWKAAMPNAESLVWGGGTLFVAPLAGLPAEVKADAQGRFKLVPYPGNLFTVTASADTSEPYLLRTKDVKWPPGGAVKKEVQITLARGVRVRDCASFGLPHLVRLGVRGEEDQARLWAAWQTLRP